jgi:hypothetical protein
MPSVLHRFLMIVALVGGTTHAFVVRKHNENRSPSIATGTATATTTQIYLEDRIARMIDQEYYREQHPSEYESQWMKQNRDSILHGMHDVVYDSSVDSYTVTHVDSPEQEFRERARDRMMASQNPERYCADRCLSTGNCDIFEDLYVALCLCACLCVCVYVCVCVCPLRPIVLLDVSDDWTLVLMSTFPFVICLVFLLSIFLILMM